MQTEFEPRVSYYSVETLFTELELLVLKTSKIQQKLQQFKAEFEPRVSYYSDEIFPTELKCMLYEDDFSELIIWEAQSLKLYGVNSSKFISLHKLNRRFSQGQWQTLDNSKTH